MPQSCDFGGLLQSSSKTTSSSAILGSPVTRTSDSPFHNSHTSLDVEDINSLSTSALGSRAWPIKERSPYGPPTRIAPTMAVITPNGPIAKRILSAQVRDCDRNCVVTWAPKRASSGPRSVKRLLEKSSPLKED